jgi:hypothetical protein
MCVEIFLENRKMASLFVKELKALLRPATPLKSTVVGPLGNIIGSYPSSNSLAIPNVLQRVPSHNIIGFRIEVKGRTGSRSMRRSIHYGSLNISKIGVNGYHVDFARHNYTTKRGATGVKVWIAYQK